MANLFVRTLNTIFIGVFLFPTFYITLKKVKKKKKTFTTTFFHSSKILFCKQMG